MDDLPLQQQSVLLLALRGADGIAKDHPSKGVQRGYRASVIKAAYLGRMMHGTDRGDSFMSLARLGHSQQWVDDVEAFFASVDSLPHHFYMHLMHGAEILAYKHPDPVIASQWLAFYLDCCADLHLPPESREDMGKRLNDGNQALWP